MCDENKIKEAYEASVNNVVDAIMDELGPIEDTDAEFLVDVIIGVVIRRLGDISCDAVGVSRSAGEQAALIETRAKSFIDDIKDYTELFFKKGWIVNTQSHRNDNE